MPQTATRTAKDIAEAGGTAVPVEVDVTQAASVESAAFTEKRPPRFA